MGGVGFETEGQGWMRIAYFVNEWINIYIPCLDYKVGELNFMNLLNGAGEVTLKSVKYIPDLLLRRYVYVPYMNSTVQYSAVQYSTVQCSTVHSTSNLFLCDHFTFCFFVILIVYL